MADTCGLCEGALLDHPQTELRCHHFFHTECLLNNMAHFITLHHHQFHQLQCSLCDEHLLVDEEVQEDNEEPTTVDHTSTRVNRLYDTNEEFRKDIKKYRDALRGASKPRKEFQKRLATTKAEIAPAYALLKSQVKALYTLKKEELVNSTEYKATRSADRTYIKYCTMLRTKYNVGPRMLAHLATRPGCKSLRRPSLWRYSSPFWLIRRALRLRLRF
jgi:hypothetical protein